MRPHDQADDEVARERELLALWAVGRGIEGARAALDRGYGATVLVADALAAHLSALLPACAVEQARRNDRWTWERRNDPKAPALRLEGEVLEAVRAWGLPIVHEPDLETGILVDGICRVQGGPYSERFTAVVLNLITVDGNVTIFVRAE